MTDDHVHEDFRVKTTYVCPDCGKVMFACAMCGKELHECPAKTSSPRLPRGFVVVEDFPDYMVNKQASVKHIATNKFCFLVRVSATGGAMINLLKDGKPHTKAAQELRDKAFNNAR